MAVRSEGSGEAKAGSGTGREEYSASGTVCRSLGRYYHSKQSTYNFFMQFKTLGIETMHTGKEQKPLPPDLCLECS